MFFVKAAFWMTVVLLLLPSNGQERYELYATVQRTAADIGSFCTRNPEVCEKTSSIASGFVQKLKNTAQTIEDMLRETGIASRRHEQSSLDPARYPRHKGWGGDAGVSSTSSLNGDTLTSEDLRPRWRGPGRI
ncbi:MULTISPECIES: DUF5330 domain-containing protein [Rhodomicrobium]|uniref:DUF5330 domain-containing protein n=1 Tax=Rhodomicrobium TaxID=1068 RepID=UPI000F741A67|nr:MULTISPECIES: DUF5330 domain-containing protein [Rhodomicrobium]